MTRTETAQRWAAYAAGTRVEHFAWWCSTYCVQSIDVFAGEPLDLEPWQLDFLAEALSVDEHGRPFWRFVVLLLPRKNGKTTMLAAYGLYHADQDDGRPEVLYAASSDKQADKLFTAARMFVQLSPHLSQRHHVRDHDGEINRVDGLAVQQRLSSDPLRLHGSNPSLVVADELAQWTTPRLVNAYGALTTGGGARSQRQIFAISAAGDAETRDGSILGGIVDGVMASGEVEVVHDGLRIGRDFRSRSLVYEYAAPIRRRSDPVERVKLANPASWITTEYLAEQQTSPHVKDHHYLQLHAGVWSESENVYIPADVWRALGTPASVIQRGARIAVGVDGSRTHDTTVIAVASMAGDLVDVDAVIYSVRQDAPHHVLHEGGRINYDAIEDDLLELFAQYDVAAAGYDPRYLDRSAEILATRLPDASIIAVEPTSKVMRDAFTTLERAAIDGRLRHRGDAAIASHLAAVHAARDDRGWVIRKRRQSRPIDAVPAMAIAVHLAMRGHGEPDHRESVYERRGVMGI